jgi:carotenoid cleavage dioxygenase
MTQAMPDNRFLKGPFAPIDIEFDVADIPIQGEVPRDLNGTFYRIGPNQQFAPRGDYHLFAGDGMAHAFHIADGKVSYRNRWMETAKFKLEREHQKALIDPMNPFNSEKGFEEFVFTDKDGLANTACLWHGGKFFVMEEGHPPFEVDPVTLESLGSYNYGGKLNTAMTAHPKVDPVTGELVFFAYMASQAFANDVALHKVNAAGELTESHMITTPYPAMVHDFVVTENYILFPVFPLTGSLERAMEGKNPFAWEPDKGASVGILPRNGGPQDIRWVECDPFFVFHFMNGFDQSGVITVDACQFDHAPLFPSPDGTMLPDTDPSLHRWTIDLNSDSPRVASRRVSSDYSEFPVHDPRRGMRDYRYGYYVSADSDEGEMYNVVSSIDHTTGSGERYSFGDRKSNFISETLFVPRSEAAAEDEGYLLTVATDLEAGKSRLAILDAQNVSAGPLATAPLEHRIPIGFHGGWRPAQ